MPHINNKKIIENIILIFGTVLILICIGFFVKQTLFSNRFSDEIGHMVGGHFILEGKSLYKDIQYNHQPLPYYLSAFVEKIFHPDTLYSYIKWQHTGFFLYCALWIMMIIATFRFRGLLIILLFSIIQLSDIGFFNLGETIAMYPLLYLAGIFFEYIVYKKISDYRLILSSLSIFVAAFSLLPLWPVLSFIMVYFLWRFIKDVKRLLLLILPLGIATTILFTSVPIIDYFRETIIYNSQYFLPSLPEKYSLSLVPLSIFLPLRAFISLDIITARVIAFLVIGIILSMKQIRKIKKQYFIICTIVLMLSNTRIIEFVNGNFHLLPWSAVAVTFGVFLISYNKKISIHHLQLQENAGFFITVIFAIIGFFLIYFPFQKPTDQKTEFYIHYSESDAYGNITKLLASPSDNLLVFPDDPLVYWVSGIPMATHVTEYYSWLMPIPRYKEELDNMTSGKTLPTFIVETFNNDEINYRIYFKQLLEDHYIQIWKNGKPSKLFIRSDKIPQITSEQWKKAKDMLFELPPSQGT